MLNRIREFYWNRKFAKTLDAVIRTSTIGSGAAIAEQALEALLSPQILFAQQEKLPKEIYQDAKKAEKNGLLEKAMRLYAKATYYHDAARIAIKLEKFEEAIEYHIASGDNWAANKLSKELGWGKAIEDPKYVEEGQVATFRGDYSQVAEVFQHEQGITNSESSKPVIASFDATDCVIYTGYDSKSKTAFLAHYDSCTDLELSLSLLTSILPKGDYQVRIIGGQTYGSKPIIDFLEQVSNEKGFEIIEKDVYGGEAFRSFALDARTGDVTLYEPLMITKVNKITDLLLQQAMMGVKTVAVTHIYK